MRENIFLAKGMVKLMNLKKIVSAAAVAAITLSAAVTSFATDVSLTWSNNTTVTSTNKAVLSEASIAPIISTGTVELEFDLLLKGSGDSASYFKAYTGNGEIMSIRRDTWSGEYYATPEKSDKTKLITPSPDSSVHFKVTMNFDNNSYTISGTGVTEYNGTISEDASLSKLEIRSGKGKNNKAQVTNLNMTHTAPAAVTFKEAKTFGESTEYEGTATAVKFTVTPGDGTVTGIDVTYDGTKKSIEPPTLTGDGAAVCGIVVGRVIDVTSKNFSTFFDIYVR